MFYEKDLKVISPFYFSIINKSAFFVVLQSKRTKHYWYIKQEEYGKYNRCVIYHKHNYGDQYHLQTNAKDLNDSINIIKEHDEYFLRKKKGNK